MSSRSGIFLPVAVVATIVLVAAAGSALAEHPQAAPSSWTGAATYHGGEEPVFMDMPPYVEVLRLENGLQVLLMQNPSQSMVSVVTQVKVGSAFEDFRTSGMSHMLEHLLFNGSDRWTQEQQYDLADRIGAWNNAHTSDFFTNFIMLVPDDHVAEGVELQAEMLFRSTFPADKFEKERGIVVGEIVEGRDRGGNEAAEAIRDALFAGSSLGMPTLGTLSTIEHMSRDDVWRFYKNHYVPNNMITTVAGNFDRAEILELLNKHYGEVPPGTVDRPALDPAPYLDRTTVVTRRTGDAHIMAMAFEAPEYGSPDYFPFLVLTHLLDASASGVLTSALDRLPAAERPGVSVWWEMAEGFGRLIIELELSDAADPAAMRTFVLDALAGAVEWGITEQDVQEVVRVQKTETLIEREQLRHLAIMSAQPIAQGGVDFFLNFLGDLGRVHAEDVSRVLGAYLVDSPHLIVRCQPRETPAVEDGGSAASDVVVERSELGNGLTLVTMQNPASPLFAAHLAARNRSLLDGEHPGAVDMVHRMLQHGVGGCDEQCTARKLRGLGAQVKFVDDPRFPMDNYYTNGRFSWIRLETATDNGPEALVHVLDLIQHAGFTEEHFADEQGTVRERLARSMGSARGRADNLLAANLYGEHPLANPAEGTPVSIAALTYDDVRRVYRRVFSPENLVLTVASSLSHERLVSLVEEQIPGSGAPGPGLPPEPVTPADVRVTGTAGGQMGSLRLGSLFEIVPADAAALELLTAVLSDRLGQDLRETRGLSYSVGAKVGVHGDRAGLIAWLNPPAPRLAEGEAALDAAVRGFDAATVTQEELDTIRNARKGRLMMRRLSSIAQAYALGMADLDGNLSNYLDVYARYDAVTLQDLVRVGNAYFSGRSYVTVVVD